ncbi:MAG: thioesterase family protein [Gordonia sp. (in: high G+C Gram-positive bacteria)]
MESNEVEPESAEATCYYAPAESPEGADGDGWEYFVPTSATVSVWAPDIQHGGPPTGLLVRSMERLVDDDALAFSRVTADILGAVGLGLGRVRATVTRPGRQISMLAAELQVQGPDGNFRTAVRASAWLLRRSDASAVERIPQPPLPAPESLPHSVGFTEIGGEAVAWGRIGFIGTLSVAVVPGRNGTTPAFWLRPELPLVGGEETTELQSLFTVVDVANGVGSVLSPMEWTWMNTDTTVHLVAPPRGRWLGVDSAMAAGREGYGASLADLYTVDGFVGRSAQTVLLTHNG